MHQQQQPQTQNQATSHFPYTAQVDLTQYQEISSQQLMVEFARNSYPLVGSIIDGSIIRGQFGYGEIQQPRNERLVLFSKGKLKQVDKVSKIIITKSIITHKKKQLVEKKLQRQVSNNQQPQQNHQKPLQILSQKPKPHNDIVENEQIQSSSEEQRFFSQSSESHDSQQRQRRKTKNLLKSKHKISKQSSNHEKSSKLGKNILKKKLKFLTQKK